MRGPPGAAAAAAHAHAQAHAQAQGMMGPVMGPRGNATHPQQVPVRGGRRGAEHSSVGSASFGRVWAGFAARPCRSLFFLAASSVLTSVRRRTSGGRWVLRTHVVHLGSEAFALSKYMARRRV